VKLAASVDCPSGQDAACRAFRDKLDADAKGQTFTTDVEAPDTSTDSTDSTDSTGGGSGTDSSPPTSP